MSLLVLVLATIIGVTIFRTWQNRQTLKWQENYLSIATSQTVKGFFVILIFLSHFNSYVLYTDPIDLPLADFCKFFGQLIVAPFFFYSGYGVYESIKKKGNDYIRSFPKRRILKTLYHFDLAILLFVALNYVFEIHYNLKTILLSLIAWDDIGNSNWFIFGILVTYLLSYIAFRLKIQSKYSIMIVFLLTLGYIALLYFFRKTEPWWYNTIVCYPLGMLYSYFKDPIENHILKKRWILWPVAVSSTAVFVACYMYADCFATVMFQVRVLSFLVLLVVWTRLFPAPNAIFKWFGNYVFEIYILQRIPMIAYAQLGMDRSVYVYFVLCAATTLLLGIVFKYVVNYMDSKVLMK